ncbi:GyrI-like domain-containing protein [Myxococcus sp. K15C18031901]|uniref:GyrI-like domain-containing protein n=1 Tax=Myxococcus dinghuensis TaxID=2906761 RepID=UPI0020A702EA|nr:GyrI-like domain-containing protein [Myxococcus dinghuensis]MCP3104315.1 GyrI-like domain-containing protein [Myxococcus dinghuensis]
MHVTVSSRHALKLVGLKVVGRRSELSHRVPLAWTELVARADTLPHRVDTNVFYGAFPESDHLGASEDGVYTYSVCAEVSEFGPLPRDFITHVVPPRDYAMLRVVGTAEAIEAAYLGLADWLRDHCRTPDGEALALERYDVRKQRVTPPYTTFDYEILKPLRPEPPSR